MINIEKTTYYLKLCLAFQGKVERYELAIFSCDYAGRCDAIDTYKTIHLVGIL